ncbi:hypothetical protein R1sor_019527 [Riccia sorocarpa]|uniref:Uncharacterized protein n=1 Tax=Riccia sorocarpa TaxID=122646 RepID=A0ABD3ICS3_9MARC
MEESDTGKDKRKRDQHEKGTIQKQPSGGKSAESSELPPGKSPIRQGEIQGTMHIETFEDSVGESAVQNGAELQQWQKLTAELDLADGWCAMKKRVGPHFTRQKVVGRRLDQARLDRIHYTQMKDWVTKGFK